MSEKHTELSELSCQIWFQCTVCGQVKLHSKLSGAPLARALRPLSSRQSTSGQHASSLAASPSPGQRRYGRGSGAR